MLFSLGTALEKLKSECLPQWLRKVYKSHPGNLSILKWKYCPNYNSTNTKKSKRCIFFFFRCFCSMCSSQSSGLRQGWRSLGDLGIQDWSHQGGFSSVLLLDSLWRHHSSSLEPSNVSLDGSDKSRFKILLQMTQI